ncbi:hypothetical protein [Mucilaginibacter paludis]|uniref:Uncharacterized protein n=1 Tax=Mucilaginibacter paludis DSM 18603 TaxID=714943 RepID=H1YGR8_9SPHI|nr:hypothetical protein [Mucilaginibacter paludis]EHQ26347.1 hypothetical protein Mucpa_2212 [Mucilaginibacter paludis DSM 18603]
MQEKEYLTKRIVVRAAKRGMKAASSETMEVMGYNIIFQDGWLVKKFPDGSIQKIEPVNSAKNLGPVILD